MPAVIFFSIYDLYKRWMACMRITLVPMVVMILGTFMHLVFCLIYVKVFDVGIVGLAYASSSKDFVLMIVIMIYSKCSR
mgnify:CR=1 FL=1